MGNPEGAAWVGRSALWLRIMYVLVFGGSAVLLGGMAVWIFPVVVWVAVVLAVLALTMLGFAIWAVRYIRPITVMIGWNGIEVTRAGAGQSINWPDMAQVNYTVGIYSRGISIIPRDPSTARMYIPAVSFTKKQTCEMMSACLNHEVPVTGIDLLMRWWPSGLPYR